MAAIIVDEELVFLQGLPMTPPPNAIDSLLHKQFIGEDTPQHRALGNQENVYIIDGHQNSEEFIVKFCKRNSSHVLKYFEPTDANELAVDALTVEGHVLTTVGDRTSLPVPEVIAMDLSPSELPPYLVLEKAPGDGLHGQFHDLSPDKQIDLIAEIGTMLSGLHESFSFSTCGPLRIVNETIEPVDEDQWVEWCDAQWQTCVERLQETRFGDLVPELRSWYETHRQCLPTNPDTVLVHDDLRPANILVDDATDAVTAIIDWEDVLAAPPEYQLARLEFLFIDVYDFPAEHQSQLRTTLYDSYGRSQPTDAYYPRRSLYQLLSVLWKTGNFHVTHQEADTELQTTLARQRRHRIQQMMSAVS